jgi:hypothetical protein
MKLRIIGLILLMSIASGCSKSSDKFIPMSYDRPTKGVAVAVDKNVLNMCTFNEELYADKSVDDEDLNDLKESGTYQIISPVLEDLQKFKQAHAKAEFYFNKDYKVFVKF